MKGAEVKDIRLATGLLQVAFAERLGVHPITLSNYERSDEHVPLTVELAICELRRRLAGIKPKQSAKPRRPKPKTKPKKKSKT